MWKELSEALTAANLAIFIAEAVEVTVERIFLIPSSSVPVVVSEVLASFN